MRLEGLLVGGSSGAALAGAIQYLQESEEGRVWGGREGANVVVLFADGFVFCSFQSSFHP